MKYSDFQQVTVVQFDEFIKFADKHLSDNEVDHLIDFLAMHPKNGVVIQGTGGIRKFRWAAKGKGKSGGARIVYYFHSTDMPLLLLSGFPKNEMENISQAARNELKKLVPELVRNYLRRTKK